MKSILVTGASTGIGRASVEHFAAAGWRVYAGVRAPSHGEALQDRAGASVCPVLLDVVDEGCVAEAIRTVDTAVGPRGLDVLVNNAGIAVAGPLEMLDTEEWIEQFDVNLFGVVRVTRAALPLLRRAVDPRVIMIGSISGRVGSPMLGPYVASKHALAGLVGCLRREVDGDGPLVTLVEPGAVRTEIWNKAVDTLDRFESRLDVDTRRRYGRFVNAQRRFLNDGDHAGVEASSVARLVERLVDKPRPPSRVLIGRDARVAGALDRLVPDRTLESLQRLLIRRAARAGDAS